MNNDSFPEKSTFSQDFNTSGGPPDISPQPPERSTEKNPTRPADLPTRKPLFGPGETYETMADRLIREAQERGGFDHLRGSGKPLDLGQSNPWEGDNALAYSILRGAGETLPWIAFAREIESDLAKGESILNDALEEYLKLRKRFDSERDLARLCSSLESLREARLSRRDRYVTFAAEVDRKIERFNLEAPTHYLSRPRVSRGRMLRRFDDLWPEI